MKRVMIIAILCLVVLVGTYAVWAQQRTPPHMGRSDGPGQQMGGMMMGNRGDGMCPMHGMMAGGMMQKSMVALSDGGVAVLVGNQLMKFDSNLELQKQTQVPIDLDKMQQQMKSMMQNCPNCRRQTDQTNGDHDSDQDTQSESSGQM